MNRARVLLADDHRMVAEGLKALLTSEFELVAVVEDGQSLIEAARMLHPDVIITDITMPHLNGIDALAKLKTDNPRVKVVLLTMHHDVAYARRALEAGASGFVLKHSAPSELVTAIRAALDGQTFVTPTLAGDLCRSLQANPAFSDPVSTLTARQREILQALVQGKSAKEIAKALNISARTVEFHKYQMMGSLRVENSAELIRFAIKHGLDSV